MGGLMRKRKNLCECGCGQVVKNRFIQGHNKTLGFKGKHHSKKARGKHAS